MNVVHVFAPENKYNLWFCPSTILKQKKFGLNKTLLRPVDTYAATDKPSTIYIVFFFFYSVENFLACFFLKV